jgi:DNA-directed RNA polymerase specialized sigma24 family protein
VLIACRSRGIQLPDAEDLYQELILRLLRDSRFSRPFRDLLARENQDPDLRANPVSRYLKARDLPMRSGRFRAFLKGVIRNLLLEGMRKGRRQPRCLTDHDLEDVQPWMEQSISRLLDRQWLARCLTEAAWQLRRESESAPTRAQRRLFEILYLSTAESRSQDEIAERYGVHRTVVSRLLGEARRRFVSFLQGIAGISDQGELRVLLADSAEELKSAIARVRAYPSNRGHE